MMVGRMIEMWNLDDSIRLISWKGLWGHIVQSSFRRIGGDVDGVIAHAMCNSEIDQLDGALNKQEIRRFL